MANSKNTSIDAFSRLGKALEELWRTNKEYDQNAERILNEFGLFDWLQFAAVDLAALYVSSEVGQFRICSENRIRILDSRENKVYEVSITKVLSNRIEEYTVIYRNCVYSVLYQGNYGNERILYRNPVNILIAMEHIYYHGDTLLLYPRELRRKDIGAIAESLSLTEEYIYGLLCWLPTAIPWSTNV